MKLSMASKTIRTLLVLSLGFIPALGVSAEAKTPLFCTLYYNDRTDYDQPIIIDLVPHSSGDYYELSADLSEKKIKISKVIIGINVKENRPYLGTFNGAYAAQTFWPVIKRGEPQKIWSNFESSGDSQVKLSVYCTKGYR